VFVCVYCQGAVVGSAISSVFSLWLAIGTFIIQPHRETLPTSIEYCNVSSDLLQNETLRGLSTTVSSTALSWNETGWELLTVDHGVMSSALQQNSVPSWITTAVPSESYVQHL